MKRFVKIALIIVLVLVAIGIILAAVGRVAFGVRVFRDSVYKGNDGWAWGVFRSVSEATDQVDDYWDDDDWDDHWDDDDWDNADKVQQSAVEQTDNSHQEDSHSHDSSDASTATAYETTGGDFSDVITDECIYQMDAETITELDFSVGAAEVDILPLEEDMSADQIVLQIKPQNCKLTLSQKGSKLKLEDKTDSKNLLSNTRAAELKLYVPQDNIFDKIDLSISAGAMSIESDLTANKMELEVYAGEIDASSSLTAMNSLDVFVGSGSAYLEEIHVNGKADMEVDAGELVVNGGELLANADLECNMGELNVSLSGSEDDYNYDLENSMGSITLNNHSYDGISREYKENNRSSWTIDAECNSGEISLKIK